MSSSTMDPDALAHLHALAFEGAMRPWSAAEFASLLAQPRVTLFRHGQAFGVMRVVADEAELLTLATHPAHRRQGLAGAVLASIIASARDQGATTLFLEVAEPNEAARALYAVAGFAETGRRAQYYTLPDGRRTDAVILSRSL